MNTKRYRIQAFLLPSVTGKPEDTGYAPIFTHTKWGANRERKKLYRSFAPGMVRVDVCDTQHLNKVL